MIPIKPETQKLLSGGINLLVPGDLMREPDALQIRNFRPNTAGSLKTRLGHTLVNATLGRINSICRVDAASPRRYAGNDAGSLYVGGALLASGFGTDEPIGMASFRGAVWITSRSKNGRHDGTNFWPWCPARPTAATAAASGSGLTGTYTYYVVFVTAEGEESAPSDGVTIMLANEQADLTNVATYSTPGGYSAGFVTKRRIYRSGGTQTLTYRVAEINDNVTTTYSDSMPEVTAATNATIPAKNYDPPALCAGLAPKPFFNRLLMFGSAANPNRLFWSELNLPHAFPGAAADDGNHVDVGEEGEWILAVTIRPRYAVIWKERSIWRMVGDPDDLNGEVEMITDAHGLVGWKALCQAGHLDMFQGFDGVYLFNGDSAQKGTVKLQPLFSGETPDIAGFSWAALNPDFDGGGQLYRAKAAMAHRNGRVYFSYPEVAATENNRTLVYELDHKEWVSDSRGFSALYDEGQTGDLLGGDGTNLIALEDSNVDNGAAFFAEYHGNYHDQGRPENLKVYTDVVIEANTASQALTVKAFYDDGVTEEALGSITTSAKTQVVFRLGTDGLGQLKRNIAIRIEGNVSSPAIIYGITLHWQLSARLAKAWDTDETDLGDRHVKSIDYFELDIQVEGTTTWKLYSDRPGAMAERTTGTIAAGARDTIRVPVTATCEGQLVRLTLNSTTGFYLWGARIRYRPFGEYIDGANSEKFLTQPLAA